MRASTVSDSLIRVSGNIHLSMHTHALPFVLLQNMRFCVNGGPCLFTFFYSQMEPLEALATLDMKPLSLLVKTA